MPPQQVQAKLQQIIQMNSLQNMYPPQRLQVISQRVQSIDFRYVCTVILCQLKQSEPHELHGNAWQIHFLFAEIQ